MKVLLVATNRERSPYPVAPLGALCVAAAARNAGHEVDFLDLGLSNAPEQDLRRAIEKDHYKAVAFGIRNLDNCWAFAPRLYFDDVRLLAETVKSCFKGPLILGGTGFSVAPHGWMQRLEPDLRRDRRRRARFSRGAEAAGGGAVPGGHRRVSSPRPGTARRWRSCPRP